MPEDNPRNGLRVGGWIPPYSPGGEPAGPIRPTARPFTGIPRPRDSFPRLRDGATMRPRLVLAAALCLACAATAAIAVVLDAARGPKTVAAEFNIPAGEAPLPTPPPGPGATNVPVSVEPSPSATSTAAITTTPARSYSSPPHSTPAATRTTAAPAGTTTPPAVPPVPPAPPAPPPVALIPGTTVGLESADQPGQRVRHSDFRARLDPIGSASSPRDRADSGFRVHAGLTGSGCVSLEAVNFPGYYLRHRNFEIRLDRNDGSTLFRQDATFCPVTIRQGTALVLRATNYPQHHVVAGDRRLGLVQTSAERATAFTPRPAL